MSIATSRRSALEHASLSHRRCAPALARALLALLLGLTLGKGAWAQEAEDRRGEEGVVVLSGRAIVREGESVSSLVVFNGPATVDGTVTGDVLAFNGDVRIAGTVEGDVTVMNGQLDLADSAVVGGDLITSTPATIAPGALVGGETRDTGTLMPLGFGRQPWSWAAWIAVTLSALALGLSLGWLAPRAVDALTRAGRAVGPSIGGGLLAAVGLPILAFVALLTVVFVPLGLVVGFALAPLAAAGYVASAWLLGARLVSPTGQRALPFLAGLAVLRALAVVPVLGGVTWVLASVYGLGAMAVAVAQARRPASDRLASPEAPSALATPIAPIGPPPPEGLAPGTYAPPPPISEIDAPKRQAAPPEAIAAQVTRPPGQPGPTPDAPPRGGEPPQS